MNEVRRGPGPDSLDAAIDEAAKRMVAGAMPPPLERAVMSAIEARDASGWRVRRWRLAFGTASVGVSMAVASLAWILADRDARDSMGPAVAIAPPRPADDFVVVERRTLRGDERFDEWDLPGPVKVAPVSVAPVVIPAVEVAPVEVERVVVAAVTVASEP